MLELTVLIIVILVIIIFGANLHRINKETMFKHYVDGNITLEAYDEVCPQNKIK